MPQTGQTPSSPIDVSTTIGADGYVHAGIPWAYTSTGNTAPNPRFTDNGCDITDNLTGLIWVKDLNTVNNGMSTNWNNARVIANNGTWCNQSAGTWRMPNLNELDSLVNYAKSNTAIWLNTAIASGGGGFSNVQGDNYWSSSSYATQTSQAWRVKMLDGLIFPDSKDTYYWLFPVRGGN